MSERSAMLLGRSKYVLTVIRDLQQSDPDLELLEMLEMVEDHITDLSHQLQVENARNCTACRLMPICLLRRNVSEAVYKMDSTVGPEFWDLGVVSDKFYRDLAAHCSFYEELIP
jgi:hypothetical protein